MIATDLPPRLTRVVTDHDCGIEVARMQALTERIEQILPHVPAIERGYIANALLTLALRALSQRGLRSQEI